MKAILVVDLPKNCGDCPCIHDEMWKCQADKQFREGTYFDGRPSWCPLKPMPEKKNTDKLQGFGNSQILWMDKVIYQNEGWNACLEEIMGETE